MTRPLSAIAFAACVFLAACSGSDSPSTGSNACRVDDDCPTGQACVALECAASDTTPDLASDVLDADAEDLGTDVADDVTDTDADIDLGDFGAPCVTDRDCDSGFCIDTSAGHVCTVPCVDTCPHPEWECRTIPGRGADVIDLCIPRIRIVCTPCYSGIECGSLADL